MSRFFQTLAAVVMVTMTAPVAAGPLEDASEAFASGDHATAMRIWLALGRQGNATAQNNLGAMYDKGQGAPQSYPEAIRWYRLAAEHGHTLAQNNLGVMYANGLGVPQDLVTAHMWVSLAAAQGNQAAAQAKARIQRGLTPDQIAEAEKLAREWKPKP